MDGLVYSEINNNITNQKVLEDLANQLNIDSTNSDEITNKLNEYLSKTTIKRACCLGRSGPKKLDGSTGVNVKIAIPPGHNLNKDINPNLKNQFKYIEKTVYVPHEFCDPLWKKHEAYCDNFMNVYCTNQTKIFTNLNNNSFDQGRWKLYAKECSCYAPSNPSYASAPHTCYMNGCADNDSGVYIDPSSRGKQCDMTICTSILNASDIKVGGSSSINPTVQQQCGMAIDKRKIGDNNTNTTTSKSFLSTITSSISNLTNSKSGNNSSSSSSDTIIKNTTTVDGRPAGQNNASSTNNTNVTNNTTIDGQPEDKNNSSSDNNTKSQGQPESTEYIIYGYSINTNLLILGGIIISILTLLFCIFIMSRGKTPNIRLRRNYSAPIEA